jgi:hypothetical protein
MSAFAHGTDTGYRNHSCRCGPCREATRAAQAKYRQRKKAEGFAGLTHGVSGTYKLGCRCSGCVTAARLKAAHYRARWTAVAA